MFLVAFICLLFCLSVSNIVTNDYIFCSDLDHNDFDDISWIALR